MTLPGISKEGEMARNPPRAGAGHAEQPKEHPAAISSSWYTQPRIASNTGATWENNQLPTQTPTKMDRR